LSQQEILALDLHNFSSDMAKAAIRNYFDLLFGSANNDTDGKPLVIIGIDKKSSQSSSTASSRCCGFRRSQTSRRRRCRRRSQTSRRRRCRRRCHGKEAKTNSRRILTKTHCVLPISYGRRLLRKQPQQSPRQSKNNNNTFMMTARQQYLVLHRFVIYLAIYRV
jgi:hypothetical protein